jgi:crossover junction endodeoxyribonuclease RuvC
MPTLVLGVDPGTRNLGWGLVQGEANRMTHVAHGVIRVLETLSLAERLVEIEARLRELIERYQPHAGSVESLFFHKDPQAAAKLGHARGVVLLCLQRERVTVAEYAPALVKSAVVGHGRAEKLQVAHMVKTLLCLDEPPPSDAADALALAITHLRRAPIVAALSQRAAGGTSHLPPALLDGLKRARRRTPARADRPVRAPRPVS